MAGCRALEKREIVKILEQLKAPRDKALFSLGIFSGFRISELLSLEISDIYKFGRIADTISVRARNMKGKIAARDVALNENAKAALQGLLDSDPVRIGPLFRSREKGAALSRRQANQVLKNAFNALELDGKLASHSMRKTYCENVHLALGEDIYKTAKAMGHRSIDSTAKYLTIDMDEINRAILSLN